MLALYFDKEFIRKFDLREDLSSELISDFYNNFIKKIRGVEVYINLSEANELKQLIETNEFYHLLSEINPAIKLLNFKNELNDNEFYNEGEISKLFFLEEINEDDLQNKTNYYFISNSTLKDKWKVFQSNNEYSILTVVPNPPKNDKFYFHSWDDIKIFAHQNRNLIIFDLYVLSNKSNQKIKDNILPCLLKLIDSSKSALIDIKLITSSLPKSNTAKYDSEDVWLDENIQNALYLLKDLRLKVNKISLVKYDKLKVKFGVSEHDRFIITNYFIIEVGSGFNIFKEQKGVNHSTSINFNSILHNKYRNYAKQKIANLEAYCSTLPHTDKRVIGPNKLIEHYLFYPNQKLELFK